MKKCIQKIKCLKNVFTKQSDCPSFLISREQPDVKWQKRILKIAMAVFILSLLSKPLALAAIDGYQKYISPYKGYHCAHARLYGGMSCSGYGERVIRKYGLIKGCILINERFKACHNASEILKARRCAHTNIDAGCSRQCGKSCGDSSDDFCSGFCCD